MLVACEDPTVACNLLTILNKDDCARQTMLNAWLQELKLQSVPVPFTDAVSCLLDDQIAARARSLLLKAAGSQLLVVSN